MKIARVVDSSSCLGVVVYCGCRFVHPFIHRHLSQISSFSSWTHERPISRLDSWTRASFCLSFPAPPSWVGDRVRPPGGRCSLAVVLVEARSHLRHSCSLPTTKPWHLRACVSRLCSFPIQIYLLPRLLRRRVDASEAGVLIEEEAAPL